MLQYGCCYHQEIFDIKIFLRPDTEKGGAAGRRSCDCGLVINIRINAFNQVTLLIALRSSILTQAIY